MEGKEHCAPKDRQKKPSDLVFGRVRQCVPRTEKLKWSFQHAQEPQMRAKISAENSIIMNYLRMVLYVDPMRKNL